MNGTSPSTGIHPGIPRRHLPMQAAGARRTAGAEQGLFSAFPCLRQARASEACPAHRLQLERRQFLLREGDRPDSLYVLASGCLRRFRLLADGRRLVIDFLLPGDLFGATTSTRHPCSIQAIDGAELYALPLARLRDLHAHDAEFERDLLVQVCAGLQASQERLMAQARMTPLERLAHFLRELHQRHQAHGDTDEGIPLPMTRNDIADYLGLTVETVSRCFTRLRRQGVIDGDDPRHVKILCGNTLHRLASN